jgi:hypothetical protein
MAIIDVAIFLEVPPSIFWISTETNETKGELDKGFLTRFLTGHPMLIVCVFRFLRYAIVS